MKSQMSELMDTTETWYLSATCNKMTEEANALIDAVALEKSRANGWWDGLDRIAERIDNLRELHAALTHGRALEELDAMDWRAPRFGKGKDCIEVQLPGGRTALVYADGANGRVQPGACTPDGKNDFTFDDWCRINANPAVADLIRRTCEHWLSSPSAGAP